jgi:multicomponent Na+:H+ antiporter subunit F
LSTTGWLVGAAALLVVIFALGVVASRGSPMRRIIALELGAVLVTLALVLLAEGYDRDVYFDLAVVLAAMTFATSLVFVRFLERWL